MSLDGDIESGCGFIGYEDFGLTAESHGDHCTLLHASGELMGVAPHTACGFVDADGVEPVDDFRIDVFNLWPVEADGFCDLATNGKDGIE